VSTIVRLESVTKGFVDGASIRPVLEDLSFQVSGGEVLALTGPSGSGKSTLLNLLAGTLAADSGSLVIRAGDEAFDFTKMSTRERTRVRRRHVGFVFQFFNLIPTLTVRENVLLPLELNGLMDLTEQSLQRLDSLGMAERADDFPDHLSGGERQRTAIARALAHQPVLVLADEPTGNLDRANAALVADMLIEHARKLGSATVLATHDEAIASRADQVLRLGN
jgi:putative ABC transport system ATP-binding protein